MRSGCKSKHGLLLAECGKTMRKHFEQKCSPQDVNGCIHWLGRRTQKGYGSVRVGKEKLRITTAHRVAWVLKHGDLAPEVLVLHKCDTPSCVNVDHLFLGSAQDNMDDMISKGRHGWRNGQPWQKLDAQGVARIRFLRECGHSQQAVADQIGIARSLISLIEHGKIQHAAVSI